MDENTNLAGLDPNSAREYVLQYIVSLKQLQKKREQLRQELKLWSDRSALAAEKGREDLKEQALAKCRETSAADEQLAAEERGLESDVQDMKRQLEMIRRQPEGAIDTDLLLAQLEQVVGEKDPTAQKFRSFEAEQDLDNLKRGLDAEKER
ncbi:MAG TPA: hypothetical protein VMW87_09405 [Spirochaetia bacterium]|nr:hypothetical protein [Spirochaetia bacterium]